MNAMYGTVEQIEWLSPSMIRVRFGGDGLESFVDTGATDQYVNALFVPDGATYSVPFDVEAIRSSNTEQAPHGRRYTVRRWDPSERRLTIDFVAHGDVGYAGRWAQLASIGDRLQMTGPSGSYRPDEQADWHLLAGDESALPAIGASIEALPPNARMVVFAVVDDREHEIELPASPGCEIHWLHRSAASMPEELLLNAVAELAWLPGSVSVFVHGEAGEVRAVRQHLLAERDIDKDSASISPYWRRNHTDEAWRAIKRQWLADQAADV